MQYTDFQQAILRLKEQFPSLDWSPEEITVGGQTELIYHWPGTCREDIIICCHQSEFEREPFTGMISSILIIPIRDNMTPSAANMTEKSPSVKTSCMPDSPLPVTPCFPPFLFRLPASMGPSFPPNPRCASPINFTSI